jgi:transposase, IS5 family
VATALIKLTGFDEAPGVYLLAPEIVAGRGAGSVRLGGEYLACKAAISGVGMLRLAGGQVESLFDDVLPVEVRELPDDLARLDVLLADPALLEPIRAVWDEAGRKRGRPSIPMASFVRLMVVKQRSGWGYETLVREVSDSLHLRRFWLISLTERVSDESTLRKLVRRLGPDVVAELTRLVIAKAVREQRFRGRAMRCDSTVVEADMRYPSDAALAVDATRARARRAPAPPTGSAAA